MPFLKTYLPNSFAPMALCSHHILSEDICPNAIKWLFSNKNLYESLNVKTFVPMAFYLMTNSLVACPLITLTRKTTGLMPSSDFFPDDSCSEGKVFSNGFCFNDKCSSDMCSNDNLSNDICPNASEWLFWWQFHWIHCSKMFAPMTFIWMTIVLLLLSDFCSNDIFSEYIVVKCLLWWLLC